MVLRAVNPKRFAAVCWSVEVVNGARGRETFSVTFTSATVKPSSFSSSMTARVASSDPSTGFSPASDTSWAMKTDLPFRSSASRLQYSSGRKASISASLSQISRRATDWTRPAERPFFTFFHSRGDR